MMSSRGGAGRDEDQSARKEMKITSSGSGRKRHNEKLQRRLMERKKRVEMNNLLHQLSSLIPAEEHHTSKEELTQQACLHRAACYINKMKERIQRLKQKKEAAAKLTSSTDHEQSDDKGINLPVISVKHYESNLEVVLVTGLKIMIPKIIAIVMEEGAEIVSASFSAAGNKMFSTIHCHEISSRIGVDSSSMYQRLKEFVLSG